MVEFEFEDYRTLIKWFELAFGKNMSSMSLQDKKTFWKMHFLVDDKIKDAKIDKELNED